MTTMIRRIFTRLVLWFQNLKGASPITTVRPTKEDRTHVEVVSMYGHEVSIHIVKTVYNQNYDRWFVPSKQYAVYQVFGLPSNDMSEVVKEAFRKQYIYPPLLPQWVEEHEHVKRIVDAYLDAVLMHLKAHHGIPIPA